MIAIHNDTSIRLTHFLIISVSFHNDKTIR